jgi:hypothetical protein
MPPDQGSGKRNIYGFSAPDREHASRFIAKESGMSTIYDRRGRKQVELSGLTFPCRSSIIIGGVLRRKMLVALRAARRNAMSKICRKNCANFCTSSVDRTTILLELNRRPTPDKASRRARWYSCVRGQRSREALAACPWPCSSFRVGPSVGSSGCKILTWNTWLRQADTGPL